MIDDTNEKLKSEASSIRREIHQIRRDLTEEQEYARSINILILGWEHEEGDNNELYLEHRLVQFFNEHVIQRSASTPPEHIVTKDWIGKCHIIPEKPSDDKASSKYSTVMV